ncbi:MAG TPA: hypothetical protein VFH58_14315 [Acidimicrobiales bacterium]|nr:hypothetical protein [Acidimicrobiales bacterium]
MPRPVVLDDSGGRQHCLVLLDCRQQGRDRARKHHVVGVPEHHQV